MSQLPPLDVMERATETEFWCQFAIQEILEKYGDACIIKPKAIHKFGRTVNADLDTARTVWRSSEDNETYATTNAIDTISSSDAGDDQTVEIEGHTVTGTGVDQEFTEVTQNATLNGQTKVTLGTPVARVSRLKNADTSAWDGTIYVYEDGAITAGVPDVANTVHLTVTAAGRQSQKAALTFSNVEYGIITSWYGGVDRTANANVDLDLEIRDPGGSFRPQADLHARTGAGPFVEHQFRPFLIVPKNNDIRVVCTSSANNTTVLGGFSGMLALTEAGLAPRRAT